MQREKTNLINNAILFYKSISDVTYIFDLIYVFLPLCHKTEHNGRTKENSSESCCTDILIGRPWGIPFSQSHVTSQNKFGCGAKVKGLIIYVNKRPFLNILGFSCATDCARYYIETDHKVTIYVCQLHSLFIYQIYSYYLQHGLSKNSRGRLPVYIVIACVSPIAT